MRHPLTGQAPNRPAPDGPPGSGLRELDGGRSDRASSFRAEVYEWQIAALLATTKLDEPAKRRVVDALWAPPAPLDTRRIGRLEQELRSLALDNAFGRVGDDDYLRRKAALTAEIEEARRPAAITGVVDPARALAWLDDLRSLWEVELPETAGARGDPTRVRAPTRRGDSAPRSSGSRYWVR